MKIDHSLAFLPEAGITIFETELDVEELDYSTALYYYTLGVAALKHNNPEKYDEVSDTPSYKDPEQDVNFDVYDLLQGILACLRYDFYPTMTEQAIVRKLVEDDYNRNFSEVGFP